MSVKNTRVGFFQFSPLAEKSFLKQSCWGEKNILKYLKLMFWIVDLMAREGPLETNSLSLA